METIKRKERNSTGSTTSEISSPEEKQVRRLKVSEASSEEDIIDSALTMAKGVGDKLDLILAKLAKLEELEAKIINIDKILQNMNNRITDEVKHLESRVKKTEEKTIELEEGITYAAKDLDKAKASRKESEEKTNEEIKRLKFKLLNMDVYQHRENLRFYGIPETELAKNGDKIIILWDFLDNVLDLTNAKSVSFQRVHHLGKITNGKVRPIIARFAHYPDREKVMELGKKLNLHSGYGVSPDLPREVVEIRKKLIPKMVEVRKQGKRASYSRAEPYKLFIDGQIVS